MSGESDYERRQARTQFQKNVNRHLTGEDKDYLNYVLKEYSRYKDVDNLVLALCSCLDNARKLNLLRDIRGLIPPAHLTRFDKLAPYHLMEDPIVDKRRFHTISFTGGADGSLGFSIRGGKEHGLGVFVSHVEAHSDAARRGLRVGDKIVEVNGIEFNRIAHSSAVKVLKSGAAGSSLKMTVLSTGRVPSLQIDRNSFVWVDSEGKELDDSAASASHEVRLSRQAGQSFGFAIRGGSEYDLGIFISSVDDGSVAAQQGVTVGDQVLQANGQAFVGISHAEAVAVIRQTNQLDLLLKPTGRIPLARSGKGELEWLESNGAASPRRSLESQSRASSSLPDMSPRSSVNLETMSRPRSRPGSAGATRTTPTPTPTKSSSIRRSNSVKDSGGKRRGALNFGGLSAALASGGRRLSRSFRRKRRDGQDDVSESPSIAQSRRPRAHTEGDTLDDLWRDRSATTSPSSRGRKSPWQEIVGSGGGGGGERGSGVFSKGIGSQVMLSEALDSRSRSVMEDQARRCLDEEEHAAFMLHWKRYEREQDVDDLVVSILPILNSPQKLDLLRDLRPLIVVGHLTRFDELVERKEMEALTARPAVAPGAEQSGKPKDIVRAQIMTAIQGGKARLRKTGHSKTKVRGDGDGSSQLGIFGTNEVQSMLQKAQTTEKSPVLRRRDSFLAWSGEREDYEPFQVVVELQRSKPNLGLVIEGGSDTPQRAIRIKAVKENSMAADDGFLKPGFEIVEVERKRLKGATHEEAVMTIGQALAGQKSTLELVVVPS
ncbi:PDZ domain-containing protein 7-like isoform X2 [Oscarella lobularis]|uniref:PDZ domain-containing protein 7-like isoform X2 n=1 Tax=Oscarella lobularis TaxID=121494 RepID=UPI003313DEEF